LFLYAKPSNMQKKFFLFLTGCLCSFLGFTQINKGTIAPHFDIGNLRSIGLTNNTSTKNTFIAFNPGVGYFIKNNWEVGIDLRYSNFHYLDKPTMNSGYNGYTLGVKGYTNYYFLKKKLQPYLTFQMGYDYRKGDNTFSGIKTNYTTNVFYTAIGGGLNWRVTSRLSFFTEATFFNESPFNRYSNHNRLNLTIGARLFFNRKKN